MLIFFLEILCGFIPSERDIFCCFIPLWKGYKRAVLYPSERGIKQLFYTPLSPPERGIKQKGREGYKTVSPSIMCFIPLPRGIVLYPSQGGWEGYKTAVLYPSQRGIKQVCYTSLKGYIMSPRGVYSSLQRGILEVPKGYFRGSKKCIFLF